MHSRDSLVAPSTALGISPADSHPSTRKPRVQGAPADARRTDQLPLDLTPRSLGLGQDDRRKGLVRWPLRMTGVKDSVGGRSGYQGLAVWQIGQARGWRLASVIRSRVET